MRSIIYHTISFRFGTFSNINLKIEYWGSKYDYEQKANACEGHE